MSSTPIVQRLRGAPFRKLSKEELLEKIKKGLCFWCDEKFGPSHVCRNKQLHMLLMTEEDLFGFVDLQDNVVNQEEDLEEKR